MCTPMIAEVALVIFFSTSLGLTFQVSVSQFGKYRLQAVPKRSVAGGEKRKAWQNDLALESQSAQHHHQSARAARHRDAMLHAQALGDGRFQAGNQCGIRKQTIAVGHLIIGDYLAEIGHCGPHKREWLGE